MTEERITEHTDQDGHTHTTHTIVTDGERSKSGALIAVVAAIYLFSNMSNAEVAKDNAVENAANQVGDAANQAGDAIENAADRVAPSE